MNTEDFDEEDERLRYEIRLVIEHPSMDPNVITKELGLAPHVTQQAGAARKTLIGTTLPGVYKISSWGYFYRIECNRYFSEDVLKLTDLLTTHAAFLAEIVEAGGSIELIVNLPGDVNIGDTISWKDLGRLLNLKVDLGFEVFPYMKPNSSTS